MQKELPLRQRDLPLTRSEQDLIERHYGLIRAVSYRFRSSRIPDLESELALQACRIVPSYRPQQGAFGPFLQASLSRYCLNLIRNGRKWRRESTETDQCAGENDLLARVVSRDIDVEQASSEIDEMSCELTLFEAVELAKTKSEILFFDPEDLKKPESQNEPKTSKDEASKEKVRLYRKARRWVKRNQEKFGDLKKPSHYAALAEVPVHLMARAMREAGYVPPKRTKPNEAAQPLLFSEI